MNTVQEAKLLGFATYMPAALPRSVDSYNETYELNRHRVYALAFWMTDSELDAAQLMTHAFCRAFAKADTPTAEEIDRCLISELREYIGLHQARLRMRELLRNKFSRTTNPSSP